ncbi:MAG: lysylphosphatidylglycerol synthase transmembrane domain-containing protein [Acidobacteriaceae bacterium]
MPPPETASNLPSDMPEASVAAAPRKSLFSARTLLPVIVLLLALFIWLAHSHASFNWASVGHQLRSVSPTLVAIAFFCTYFGYWLRAWRWSVLLAPLHKTNTVQMLPSQLIGFTIVALFGRFADLGRPYLIARRLKTPVATQLAVYSIERAFDLASAAIIFSTTLAFAPHDMPHHEAFARAGIVSLAATIFLAVFALSLRFAGRHVANIASKLLHPISETFAHAASERILEFSHGFSIVSTLGEFFSALAISVGMWLVIALMYFETAHAFRATPSLATLSFAATMLLLATSLGGSMLQLPIVGWFTQIAILAATLHGFFNVPLETATACGALLLLVSNLAVIPGGFIAAHLEGISLREAASSPSTT